MSNFLHIIQDKKRQDIALAKKNHPLRELEKIIDAMPPCRNFSDNFQNRSSINVIAELKSASPSCGVIRTDFDVPKLAEELISNHAAALSILTEKHYFGGRLEYLSLVSEFSPIPLLRKDFIFDDYQVYESRANGADAILLIRSLLPEATLFNHLLDLAHHLGLQVLGEAHDAAEVDFLLDTSVDLIGVNARNLSSLQCDLSQVQDLLQRITSNRLAIAESSIKTPEDIRQMHSSGAAGFLIGETLMRAASPGQKLQELMQS